MNDKPETNTLLDQINFMLYEGKPLPKHLQLPENYPEAICSDCGKKYGRKIPDLATFYPATCGVCKQEKICTEPRDYGHLKNGWQNHNE